MSAGRMEGMDTNAGRALAASFADAAGRLRHGRQELDATLRQASWQGPDHDHLLQHWNSRLRGYLDSSAAALDNAASQLRTQAEEQERASGGSGGGGTSGPGGRTMAALGGGLAALGLAPTKDPDDPGDGKRKDHPVTTGVNVDNGTAKVDVTAKQKIKLAGDTTIKGVPVSGELSVAMENKVVAWSKDNGNQTTTYQVDFEGKLVGTASGKVGGTGAGVTVEGGARGTYKVTVPTGVDPLTIDPTDPGGWPKGTRVEMSEETFKGLTTEVSYRRFGLESSSEDRAGNSVVIQKSDDNRASVVIGPTAGFSSDAKLKFDLGKDCGVSVSTGYSYDSQKYVSFNVDTSTPGGQNTYLNAVVAGIPPEAGDRSVSDWFTAETGEWASKKGAAIQTPFGTFSASATEGSNSVMKTYSDGRTAYTQSFTSGDTTLMTKSSSSADGVHYSEPQYSYDLPIRTEQDAMTARNLTGDPTIKVGDTVNTTISESSMAEMRSRDAVMKNSGPTTADQSAGLNTRYANNLARDGNTSGGVLSDMFYANVSPDATDLNGTIQTDAAGRPIGPNGQPLPGTITVTRT